MRGGSRCAVWSMTGPSRRSRTPTTPCSSRLRRRKANAVVQNASPHTRVEAHVAESANDEVGRGDGLGVAAHEETSGGCRRTARERRPDGLDDHEEGFELLMMGDDRTSGVIGAGRY